MPSGVVVTLSRRRSHSPQLYARNSRPTRKPASTDKPQRIHRSSCSVDPGPESAAGSCWMSSWLDE
jgi:hypothetical protein